MCILVDAKQNVTMSEILGIFLQVQKIRKHFPDVNGQGESAGLCIFYMYVLRRLSTLAGSNTAV